ncbi:hypothetical protein CEXT_316451 [Caerostris extrusa]|uniref:Uncharacterized protein n=1 Tax=Caerostris extrusa TaxID=172846 RepID=A0AAV4VKI9_CAEEX|nr:hypothetical protein CEXT_316451 [Caerostris extrusa]
MTSQAAWKKWWLRGILGRYSLPPQIRRDGPLAFSIPPSTSETREARVRNEMITQRSMVVGQRLDRVFLWWKAIASLNARRCSALLFDGPFYFSGRGWHRSDSDDSYSLPRYSWLLPVMLWPRARDSRKKKGL